MHAWFHLQILPADWSAFIPNTTVTVNIAVPYCALLDGAAATLKIVLVYKSKSTKYAKFDSMVLLSSLALDRTALATGSLKPPAARGLMILHVL